MMQRRTPRAYQTELIDGVCASTGHPLVVLPTGGGKTVVLARIISSDTKPTVVVAHRKELVAQISGSLASDGVTHRVIAPRATVRAICAANAERYGQAFVSPIAPHAVAGVDSLKQSDPRIERYIQDEGHHMLQANKWGRAAALFPNAQIVGFTATPERTDGKGLGAHADGLYTEIIRGPDMRSLINSGYLSDYRLFAPESAMLDLSAVPTGSTGDYVPKHLKTATRAAQITGDVVEHYKRQASGLLGVTFVTDVESAHEMAEAYNAAGVPAAAVSAKTPAAERTEAIRKFARRELLQLVNVDLFGEGFDLSNAAGMDVCIECVSMARPTMSYVVYSQQFGRALRLGGPSIIIDHVGNVMRHGLPDSARPMSLDARPKRGRGKQPDDVPKVRACEECTGVYPRELDSCPYCGHSWAPSERGSPEAVDGDLVELDATALAELRAAADRAVWGDDKARQYYESQRIPQLGVLANVKRQRETRTAQELLRDRIDAIGREWHAEGATESQIMRRFYLEFGVDVLSACGLKAAEAKQLLERLNVQAN